ncbi:hopanoid-associated sugar epimerase [Acidocella aromatica]|uniref:Dihydroflavonol-4-reductase n=1 Tax=Acidocella aromatica TaxID=1303579 RepID=A0A840VDB2_9PROT|nr:hopanoid-associated sugar epimerase [Acidocella aromatica]MBB5373858.1 dihydroflavonol-4-reductase [Acidocella aromatica]
MARGDLVLVTGATGFVGAAVARTLQQAGFSVRVTARAGSDLRNLKDLAAEIAALDLNDPTDFAPALAGCRYLFHVAADYRLWVPDVAAMRKVNIDGSVALLRAAQAAGVERSVYTSSVAALGLAEDGSPADEHTKVKPAHHVGAYKQSKYDAEQAVRALAQTGQDIVIVNPSTPVGPGDVKPTPTGQMILDAARGKMPAYVDTGLNVVHVDDVAAGHLLALEKGRTGEAYILGGEDLMLGELFAMIARMTGRAAPSLRLPIAPLMPLAWVMERIAEITGKTPLMTPDILKMARKKMFFSSAKAKAELGYAPRPAEAAVADALTWFRTEGLLA